MEKVLEAFGQSRRIGRINRRTTTRGAGRQTTTRDVGLEAEPT
jgi:hypothetical protein